MLFSARVKHVVECGVVTCDSCKDAGRFADRSCVSRANREVIGCAARHWKLKVCGGNPIRRDHHQSMWAVLYLANYLYKVFNISTVHTVP